jgi:hypothetical protein
MMKKSLLIATVLGLGISTASLAGTPQPAEKAAAQVTAIEQNSIQKSIREERLEMLERSIVPKTPNATIALFAEAVKSRNGALQYALFSGESRVGLTKSMENSHWVTGVSSPWVETYKILSQKELIKHKRMEFIVEFDLATSTGKAGKDAARVTVEKIDDRWYITSLGPYNNNSIGIWNTHESVKEQNLEQNLKKMVTYNSSLGYKIQLPKDIMEKIVIKDATCKNEKGNPPCTFFYYKDKEQKKDILLLALIRLTKEQEKSKYYQEHPFLTKVGANNKGSFYYSVPSEHPYGEKDNTAKGKEWSYLVNVLKGRIHSFTPNS